MTKDEFIKKAKTKLSTSFNKTETIKEIIKEIDGLTYQETNNPISKKLKVEISEEILWSRFPSEKTRTNMPRLIENSNEEYLKILIRSIERNK